MKKSDVDNTINVAKEFFNKYGKDADFDNFCDMIIYQFFADLCFQTENNHDSIFFVLSTLAVELQNNFSKLEED